MPRSTRLFLQVYEEMRQIARRLLRREALGHTLQPTALVNEAYLKLAGQLGGNIKSRTHFLAIGANVMRRLLVDHARRRGAAKRGGGLVRVDLERLAEGEPGSALNVDQLLNVNEALERLSLLSERQARVVTLRFYGGLTNREVAEVIGVSTRTVEDDWRHARAWLQVEMRQRD